MPEFDLAQFQRDFVAAVIDRTEQPEFLGLLTATHSRSPADALETYRNDYSARLTDVLLDAFASTHYIVGDDVFFALCERFLATSRSQSYDLGRFGGDWPAFMLAQPEAHEFPFLPDLGALEWRLREIFDAAPVPGADLSPLLNAPNPEDYAMQLLPSLHLSRSEYPVFAYWNLRKTQSTRPEALPNLEGPEYLAAYKNHLGVRSTVLKPAQHHLLQALHAKKTLGEALESLEDLPPEQVSDSDVSDLSALARNDQIF